MISFLRFAVAIPHGRVKASPLPYTPGTPRPRPAAAAARRCRRPARRGRAPLGRTQPRAHPAGGSPERPPGGGRLAAGRAGHEGGPQPRTLPAERLGKVPHSSAARSRSGWGLNAPRKARARPPALPPPRCAQETRISCSGARRGCATPQDRSGGVTHSRRTAGRIPRKMRTPGRLGPAPLAPRPPALAPHRLPPQPRRPERGQRPGALSERSPLRETPSATADARRPAAQVSSPSSDNKRARRTNTDPRRAPAQPGGGGASHLARGGSRCGAGGRRARAPTRANPAALEPPPRSRPGLRAPTGRAARSYRAPAAGPPPLPAAARPRPRRGAESLTVLHGGLREQYPTGLAYSSLSAIK